MQTIGQVSDDHDPPLPAAAGGAITCRLAEIGAAESQWRRLEGLPRNSLHQGFAWCSAWSATHGHTPLVVEGREGANTVFLLPLEVVRRGGIRIASFPGGSHNNLNTGLFAEDFQPSAVEQLHIGRQIGSLLAGKADLVMLEGVPRRWRDVDHPLAALCQRENPNHSFQLPLYPAFDETLKQLNAKRRRKKFRTQTRRLDDAGGYEHWVPDASADRHALLDLFFQQKRVRFEAHGLPDVFADADVQAFFHALLDSQRSDTAYPLAMHAIRLKDGGDVAAIAGLSRKGDHVICQFGSIDDKLVPDASPGELLFWLMIEESCGSGAALFDFGIGDQAYKRSWCPVETVLYDIAIPVSAAGHVAAAMHAGMARAKSCIKRNPALYRILQRLRATRNAPVAAGQD